MREIRIFQSSHNTAGMHPRKRESITNFETDGAEVCPQFYETQPNSENYVHILTWNNPQCTLIILLILLV